MLNHLAIRASPLVPKGCVFVSTSIRLQLLYNVDLGGYYNILNHLAIEASPPGQNVCVFVSTRICLLLLCNVDLSS